MSRDVLAAAAAIVAPGRFTSVQFSFDVLVDAGPYFDLNFVLSAVPEPATWAMMIGGFGLIGAAARHRTNTKITYA